MDADRREAEIKKPISDMERGSDEMEHRLDQLGEEITDARKTADQRQDAPSDKDGPDAGETAGDWEGEASGASQGEDAEDAEGGEQQGGATPEAQEEIDRGAEQRDRQMGDEDPVGDASPSDDEDDERSSDDDDEDDGDKRSSRDEDEDEDDGDGGGDEPQGASDAQEQIDRGVEQRDPDGEAPPEDAR